jgi:hypothetical protein
MIMMRRTTKAALAMLLAGAGLAAALPLSAQTTPAPTDTPTRHHMMGGDMGAMMKMMGEMRTMADACQRMMQGTAHQSGKDTGRPHHNPSAKTDGQQ